MPPATLRSVEAYILNLVLYQIPKTFLSDLPTVFNTTPNKVTKELSAILASCIHRLQCLVHYFTEASLTISNKGVQLAKNDFLWFGFWFSFAKKLRFSVRLRFYKINCGFVFLVRLGLLHSSIGVDAIFHLRLYAVR